MRVHQRTGRNTSVSVGPITYAFGLIMVLGMIVLVAALWVFVIAVTLVVLVVMFTVKALRRRHARKVAARATRLYATPAPVTYQAPMMAAPPVWTRAHGVPPVPRGHRHSL